MELRLYETPGGFLEDNAEFLRRNEAACQLNLENAEANRETACGPRMLFGRWEEKGEPVLLFGSALPRNLCLNGIPGSSESVLAAEKLALWLREKEIPIAGVTCSEEPGKRFRSAYGGRFQLHTAMDILVMRKLIPPPAVPGRFRKAEERDLELLAEWNFAFYREAVRKAATPEDCKKKVQDRYDRGELYLWEDENGEPASTACILRDLAHGCGVSYVYTPAEKRGRGYCQSTVAALCGRILSSGRKYATLLVDQKNPISNRVYRKIGFETLQDCCEYVLLEG